MAKNITDDQKLVMVQYFEEHPQIYRTVPNYESTTTSQNDLWKDLTSLLNGCSGPSKSASQWKRSWGDIKSAAKKAGRDYHDGLQRNGNQSLVKKPTKIQYRIIAIIGETLPVDYADGTQGAGCLIDDTLNKCDDFTDASCEEPDPILYPIIKLENNEPAVLNLVDAATQTALLHSNQSSSGPQTLQDKGLELQKEQLYVQRQLLASNKRLADAMEDLVYSYKRVHRLTD